MAAPVVSAENLPQRRVVKYLNNKDLLIQIRLSKAQLKMTNQLATMLQLLCARYAKKGNFANYSYNDDMQGYAMLMICKTWKSFDETKSNNPFAFYTQCIKNSFIQYLNQEKRQRDIRDNLLIDSGMNPSLNMQMRGDDGGFMSSDDFEYSGTIDPGIMSTYQEDPDSNPVTHIKPPETVVVAPIVPKQKIKKGLEDPFHAANKAVQSKQIDRGAKKKDVKPKPATKRKTPTKAVAKKSVTVRKTSTTKRKTSKSV